MSLPEAQLVELGRHLQSERYRFITVTPRTHALLNERNPLARDLRDVFGWNRPFHKDLLPRHLFDLMCAAAACRERPDGTWQATVRFSSLDDLLFLHGGFPTTESNAVFFGPDSYRFARAVLPHLPQRGRLIDVGCGSGVGGIVAAKRAGGGLELVLADVNPAALAVARVNLKLAGLSGEVVHSDVLDGVRGDGHVVISNPPYLADAEHRTYRDGGQHHGAELSLRIAEQALSRLSRDWGGGMLLLYTGTAIVRGTDRLQQSLQPLLTRYAATHTYEELDPDVFSEELEQPAYGDVERIAVVLLRATTH